MGDTTAALVWGIPVRISDLLCSVDAFHKAIPTIQTLRLCNQFGQGEDARITKLPKELIAFIEEELLAIHRQEEESRNVGWAQTYRCFEGSCRASRHSFEMDPSIVDAALEELYEEHPEWLHMDEETVHPKEFDELLEAKLDEKRDEYYEDVSYDLCFDNICAWPSDVKKHVASKGNEVVRKHFGLDIFVKQETLDETAADYLMSHDKAFAKSYREFHQATICYLVIPSKAARWKARLDPILLDSGEIFGESTNSMLLDRNSLDPTEEHQQRFARAMRQLALKPSVHPSQLQTALSAAPPINASSPLTQTTVHRIIEKKSDEEVKKRDAAMTKRIRDLEQSQWPKLMFLVNHIFHE
ncbi:MAG: Exoribonuclease family protein [Aureobasidium pullulans]|nr:MAG: Exoribonuclease family protein [Aureobasidium pullulans]